MNENDTKERPEWFAGKVLNEVLFCEAFLEQHPMVRVSSSFFTKEGRVTDEESVRKQIYEMLRPYLNCGLAKRASGLLEMLKLEALKSTHYIKSLITAEMPMDLERKGEQSYQGEMYVRFLAFSNGDLESLYDHSDGFYRRQLILSVKRKSPDREDDPFLADKLCGEIEGIFLWCLEGLRRLQAHNFRFTESSQTKSNREEAKQEADNVLLFLRSDGYIRLKADCATPSAELYAIYSLWCSDNMYKPLAPRTVSMTLKKHAEEFNLEHDNHITNALGKRVNGFWGIEALIKPTFC